MDEPAQTDWQARALSAERRADEAWAAYHRLAADREDAAYFRRLLEDHQRSMSWRITAPLRLGMAVLRRGRRAVRRELERP
jgi:hypothetical protein